MSNFCPQWFNAVGWKGIWPVKLTECAGDGYLTGASRFHLLHRLLLQKTHMVWH